MYFITILFDIQCYDFVSRAPSRYDISLVILRVNINLHLEGDTVPTRWRFYLDPHWNEITRMDPV